MAALTSRRTLSVAESRVEGALDEVARRSRSFQPRSFSNLWQPQRRWPSGESQFIHLCPPAPRHSDATTAAANTYPTASPGPKATWRPRVETASPRATITAPRTSTHRVRREKPKGESEAGQKVHVATADDRRRQPTSLRGAAPRQAQARQHRSDDLAGRPMIEPDHEDDAGDDPERDSGGDRVRDPPTCVRDGGDNRQHTAATSGASHAATGNRKVVAMATTAARELQVREDD